MKTKRENGTIKPTSETRETVRTLVDRHGLSSAARLLGVHTSVVLAVLADLGIRRGSALVIAQALTNQAIAAA